MGLTRLEQETIIIFNEAEELAEVFTYNGRLKNKLNKLCKEHPEEYQRIKSNGAGGVTFTAPKKRVNFTAPKPGSGYARSKAEKEK